MIISINIVIFCVVAKVIYNQNRKNTDKSKMRQTCIWLRSTLTLVVIMGLTWITGILLVYRPEVAPLAYLYTFMVAFQGLFIFLLFVVFSQAVRQAYLKAWKERVNESDFLSKHFGNKLFLLEKVNEVIDYILGVCTIVFLRNTIAVAQINVE